MAVNSARHFCAEPKSRASACDIASVTRPSPPMLAKYSSCSSVELSATSSSRFRLLIRYPGAVAKSSFSSCSVIAFRRLSAPP